MLSYNQELEGSSDEEAKNKTARVTTADLLPVKNIDRDTILTKNGNLIRLLKIPGEDMNQMSASEKAALIRYQSGILSNAEEPLAFYGYTRPRNIKPLIKELNTRREAEKDNLKLREQYWVEQNYLEQLDEESQLTERDYFMTIRAKPSDLKQAAEIAAIQASEDDDEPTRGKVTFKNILKYGIKGAANAPSETESQSQQKQIKSKTKKENIEINPDVAASLGFKAESIAAQFRGKILKNQEIVNTLAAMYGSESRANNANFLEQIGAVSFRETANFLKLGTHYIACLYINELPKALKPAALFDIIKMRNLRAHFGIHIQPRPKAEAEKKLRNKQGLLGAVSASSGKQDLKRDYRIAGIDSLLHRLARDDSRLFAVNVTLAIRATSYKKLMVDLQRVTQRLTELDFGVATANRFQYRAFMSCVPFGECWLTKDKFMLDRVQHPNLPSENVACLLPNCVPDNAQGGGIMIGVSKADGGLVTYNRWLPNDSPHTVILSQTGGGKTYGIMEEILREMLKNPELGAYMIDPQGGVGLTRLIDGAWVDLGPKGNVIINPMDRYTLGGNPETIGERVEFLVPLCELMAGAELPASVKAALAQALKRLYHHFENGESLINLLALNFLNNPLYAAMREDIPQVLEDLQKIYTYLKEKYQIPTTGLVRGKDSGSSANTSTNVSNSNKNYSRPICHYNAADNRYYYRGDGMTSEYLSSDHDQAADPTSGSGSSNNAHSKNGFQTRPADVWYPDPVWLGELSEEFNELVQESGVFGRLDSIALQSAIRDSFVELRLGMPILSDWFVFLTAEGAINLVNNLARFADPELNGKMFNGFTNVRLDNRFICFNIVDLDDGALRPIRIFQTINFTWGQSRAVRKPRLFICDEAGALMKSFASVGDYLAKLFMRGRFFGLSMTLIAQNLTSIVDNQSGLECLENAGRVVLLRQQQAATHRLQGYFGLTDTQINILLNAEPGESLQLINKKWVHVRYSIAPAHLKGFDMRPEEQKKAVAVSAS